MANQQRKLPAAAVPYPAPPFRLWLASLLLLTAVVAASFAHAERGAPPAAAAIAPQPAQKTAPPDGFTSIRKPDRSDSPDETPVVRLSAPVDSPYANSAYHDLGGQPETGADALTAQAIRGH
jgi:hypothetical protein